MTKNNSCFIIKSPQGDSTICIEKNGFSRLKKYVGEHHKERKVAVITDENVARLYRKDLKKALPKALVLAVKPGDQSKSLKVVESLLKSLLEAGFDRKCVVVGLGGGMVTDLAGFVASIYMRGIAFIAMPTTLLGMIDAAVGGKTGVNLGAKNSVGTFYPAELNITDAAFLKTLPEPEIKNGLGEAIKYAATLDASLEKVLLAKNVDYAAVIQKGIAAKVAVCNKDLKEGGLRKVLNFGHTLGHAVEYLSKYKLMHGEAVSIGMTLANKIAQKLGKQNKETGERIEAMQKRHGLPTEIPEGMKLKAMIDMVYHDKKMAGKEVAFILSRHMGKAEMVKLTPEKLIDLL